MVTSHLPSHSASHLLVLRCSARTTLIRLTFTIHNGFCAPKVNRFPENSEQGQIDVAFFLRPMQMGEKVFVVHLPP